jgi:DMSO/TMAO reductase YedYZ molybdopterin-dependent catalytic subunit
VSEHAPLPPGQYESDAFPRFGLTPFAKRFPKQTHDIAVEIGGNVEQAIVIGHELARLPRVHRTADFHCVTTWSHRSLRWSGVRFADFYEHIVVPNARPAPDATFVVLRGQDGARTSLPLSDLLADSVLLADRLNDEPLSIAHGAPLRLIAPAHYAYKSAKYLSRIEFWRDARHFRPVGFAFMDHPRARVEFEERGRVVPGWLLRYLYRPLVRPTVNRFRRELERHLNEAR